MQKGLQISVDTRAAARCNITDIPLWLETDMWRSMNARWRPELTTHENGRVSVILQLPLFHRWGDVSKGTLKFLDPWREGGVLSYQEVSLLYEDPGTAPTIVPHPPRTQKEPA